MKVDIHGSVIIMIMVIVPNSHLHNVPQFTGKSNFFSEKMLGQAA
jgi:hypothetical protein